ncbi:MAG: DoxX family membrane protein [Saprospiraceae bacterium]|nr:DoxX family membrane protein [Saprospiraceae bacterium]
MTLLIDLFRADGVNFTFVKMLTPMLMAILFLQSGLDKLFNYAGNLAYFESHFKNSPLSKTVGLLLPTITALEIAAGVMCAIGVVGLYTGNEVWAFWGLILSALSLIFLFFGQRMAKDYAGAGGLMPYFVACLIGLLMLL